MNYELSNDMNINAQLRYEGERDDKDFSNFIVQRVQLPAFTLLIFPLRNKIFSYLMLTGRIENLFDKKYEEVLYYGTLRRSFYAGINLNL